MLCWGSRPSFISWVKRICNLLNRMEQTRPQGSLRLSVSGMKSSRASNFIGCSKLTSTTLVETSIHNDQSDVWNHDQSADRDGAWIFLVSSAAFLRSAGSTAAVQSRLSIRPDVRVLGWKHLSLMACPQRTSTSTVIEKGQLVVPFFQFQRVLIYPRVQRAPRIQASSLTNPFFS